MDLNLDELIKTKKYNYVITVHDKFLSDWKYVPESKNFYLFIFCKNEIEKDTIMKYLKEENSFNYINVYYLKYKNEIKNLKNKSYKVNYTIKIGFPIAFKN